MLLRWSPLRSVRISAVVPDCADRNTTDDPHRLGTNASLIAGFKRDRPIPSEFTVHNPFWAAAKIFPFQICTASNKAGSPLVICLPTFGLIAETSQTLECTDLVIAMKVA